MTSGAIKYRVQTNMLQLDLLKYDPYEFVTREGHRLI